MAPAQWGVLHLSDGTNSGDTPVRQLLDDGFSVVVRCRKAHC